jgi:N-sulfoglucosamine sulfohydrolase
MGTIPDWRPIYYQWEQVQLPYYVPDTEPARRDIAAQYMTISRLDQGIGLVLKELRDYLNDTLIVYTSDNGPPFPSGRTNFYEPGIAEPLLISSPTSRRKNEVTSAMASHLDLMPTFLDWFNITYETDQVSNPENDLETNTIGSFHDELILTGKSLLPILNSEPPNNEDDAIFGSQNFHEITMNYPMRLIRTRRYKLIHNINYQSFFPIDQDFYVSPTFQDILNRTLNHEPLPWYKNLNLYYKRMEWELYDLRKDPSESRNLINNKQFDAIRMKLQKRLNDWLVKTNDPWRCAPHGVLQDKGPYKDTPQCLTLAQPDI